MKNSIITSKKYANHRTTRKENKFNLLIKIKTKNKIGTTYFNNKKNLWLESSDFIILYILKKKKCEHKLYDF